MQSIMDDMADLQALYDERAQIQEDIANLEAELFSKEELETLNALPEEDRLEAKKRSLEEKLKNGEITQAQYDAWVGVRAKEAQNALDIARIEEKLFAADNNKARIERADSIAQQLFNVKQELLNNRTDLAKSIQNNDQFLNQLDRLKKIGDTAGSNAELIVLLDSRPDLGITFPEDASFEEKVEMVQTATNEQTLDLQREQVTVEEEIVKVEAAQETLNVAAGEAQTNEYAQNTNLDVEIGNIEAASEKDGTLAMFNQMSFGSFTAESDPAELNITGSENPDTKTPTEDLPGINQRFS